MFTLTTCQDGHFHYKCMRTSTHVHTVHVRVQKQPSVRKHSETSESVLSTTHDVDKTDTITYWTSLVCMYVCVRACVCEYLFLSIPVPFYVFVFIYCMSSFVCLCAFLHVLFYVYFCTFFCCILCECVLLCMCVFMHLCVLVCVCGCGLLCMYFSVCACVCVCFYIYNITVVLFHFVSEVHLLCLHRYELEVCVRVYVCVGRVVGLSEAVRPRGS